MRGECPRKSILCLFVCLFAHEIHDENCTIAQWIPKVHTEKFSKVLMQILSCVKSACVPAKAAQNLIQSNVENVFLQAFRSGKLFIMLWSSASITACEFYFFRIVLQNAKV